MEKVNWRKKLTSRKFWLAVTGFVTALLLGFGISESDAAQVTSIIMAGATLIAYILGEGLVDAEAYKNEYRSKKSSDDTIL